MDFERLIAETTTSQNQTNSIGFANGLMQRTIRDRPSNENRLRGME